MIPNRQSAERELTRPPDWRIQAGGVLLATAFVIGVYWPAIHFTYRLDDFVWLSFGRSLGGDRGLLWAFFSPQAQGTIRPLGDRLWFMLASSWFGLNPVPFHILALCVQIGNVLLVADTGRLLLQSRLAAAIAVVLWVANDILVVPMVWASAFDEVFYTFCFLAAFNAFLRWLDTEKYVWLVVHIVALALSLGAFELAVTFPAVAGAYVLLFARHQWRKLLPSAALASAFAAVHFAVAPLPHDGPYRMFFGWGVAGNFWHYWATVLGPEVYGLIHGKRLIFNLGTVLLTAAILLWVGISARGRRWLPLFCVLWFVIPLTPVLPLLNQFMPFYAFLSSIGIAWLAGDAFVRAASWRAKVPVVLCAGLYAMSHIPSTLFVRDWNRDQFAGVTQRQARLTEAVREIRQVQPHGPVFLSGLDMEQFWWGLCYGQLAHEGFTDLHLFPDRNPPAPPTKWCFTQDFQLSPEETMLLLREKRGTVYDVTQLPPKALPALADR